MSNIVLNYFFSPKLSYVNTTKNFLQIPGTEGVLHFELLDSFKRDALNVQEVFS